ncbi:MAG: tetratricopeptide repeat protein [Pedosphaera sp.]|nr:tetratricopeptide repeat protein [Pedosphaera sp.]MSS99798.1 tetratricopeptide repeat protein [Pedosphaera sp.]
MATSPDSSESVEVLVASAHSALNAGDVQKARQHFRDALEKDPSHPQANYWLGVIHLQTGRVEEALPLLKIAVARNPSLPDARVDLGLAHHLLGHADKAQACFKTVADTAPDYIETQRQSAIALEQEGDLPAAAEACRRALLISPRDAMLWRHLAMLNDHLGHFDSALLARRALVDLEADNAIYRCELGQALLYASRPEDALIELQKTIELAPALLVAHGNLGLAFYRLKRFPEAHAALGRAAAIAPHNAEVQKAIGDIYQAEGRLDEAIGAWLHAVELKADYVDAWRNLGLAFEHKNRLAEAISCHQKTVSLQPDNHRNHRCLAIAQMDAGQLEASQASIARALHADPADPESRWHQFSLRAFRGEFPAAWADYECRAEQPHRIGPGHVFTEPLWEGQPLAGRTLLLHCEQGLGDTLLAARYLPHLASYGGRVLLWCPAQLVDLLQRISGPVEVFSQRPTQSTCDFHLPLMSLPGIFQTTLETIPRETPYLSVPPQSHFPLPVPAGTRLRVGLVWTGSRCQPIERRPIPLIELQPIFDLPGISYYSLQVGTGEQDLVQCGFGWHIVNLAPELTDFGRTAAALSQLDLLITIDTSVAHLAGALGKPTWLLLSFAPDWRWLRERDDSPWYPTMRLFRQPLAGSWATVVEQVHAELRHLLARL